MEAEECMSARSIHKMVPAVLAAVVFAMPTAASAQAAAVPFVVLLQGNANPTPTDDPCILVNTETGTGQSAAHGTFTRESRRSSSVCATGDANVDGEFTLTAANGDRLSGTYRTSAHLDFQAGVITAVGRCKVTDGTGGFAGAKGKGVIALFGRISE
jgi:hypothetical protein